MAASYDVAFEWLMDSEDPARDCRAIEDAPPGAMAISGINSYMFPTTFHRLLAFPPSKRMPEVSRFYRGYFWEPSLLPQFESDEIAKRFFDASVNMGSQTATKLLQTALGGSLVVDGVMGMDTLQAVNAELPGVIVRAFQDARAQHYRDIVEGNPADEKYLEGWLRRAER
jgi:predicted peptidoglycan binding protein